MRSRAGLLLLSGMVVCCAASFAQSTPQPNSPQPNSPQTRSTAATAQTGASPSQTANNAPGQVPTVKASAQLVVVDVVVTDSAHRPVHGLTAHDFTIAENGVRQVTKS